MARATLLALAGGVAAGATPPACTETPARLLAASRGAGITVLYPPGRVGRYLDHLGTQFEAGQLEVPAAGPESEIPSGLAPAARLVTLLETLMLLESEGVHRSADGSLYTSRTGLHVGFLQLGPDAARAGGSWLERRLPDGFVESSLDPARLRARWSFNLRLGAGYFLSLWARHTPEAGASPHALELALMRTLAAYLDGPSRPYLAGDEAEFRRGVAGRPEVRRYLRHGAFALGLTLGEAWEEALSARLTREAGGTHAERARVLRARRQLSSPCRP